MNVDTSDENIKIFHSFIEIQTKIYKTTEHPHVATTLALIAEQWSNMGEYQKALEQFKKVLGKNEEVEFYLN